MCRLSFQVGFDSILVRLKVSVGVGVFVSVTLFRFHTGSIKRLEEYGIDPRSLNVSIPYWFD